MVAIDWATARVRFPCGSLWILFVSNTSNRVSVVDAASTKTRYEIPAEPNISDILAVLLPLDAKVVAGFEEH